MARCHLSSIKPVEPTDGALSPTVGGAVDDTGMSVLTGIRIELRDAQGKIAGAILCEDKFEAVAVPQRGDLLALNAIAGPPTAGSSFAELQSVQELADAFPFVKVDHLEHHPTADHEAGERPGCIVVLHGSAPSDDEGASAGQVVRPEGLGYHTRCRGSRVAKSFCKAAYAWLAEEGKPWAD